MDIIWGILLVVFGLIAWGGQVLSALTPKYAQRVGLMEQEEDVDPDAKLMEATHFGLRRLRERQKGMGYKWPFVLTAVLVNSSGSWHFSTIHWSMPVD